MPQQPTVLCIQDLSCVGRCSLAVVLPALAAMGVQPCPLPTALLSAHMAFESPAVTDESDFIARALSHYDSLGLRFSCVYSGYLADAGQIGLVQRAFRQSPDALKLVDPVMADHGRPYASMTPPLREAIAQLCRQADIIVPNATEALLLLGEDPAEHAWSEGEMHRRMAALMQQYPLLRAAVVTGVQHADGRFGNLCCHEGQICFLPYCVVPQSYPGTGDLFAAVFTGALLQGQNVENACRISADFVALAVRETAETGGDTRFGVRFEPLLGRLAPAFWDNINL